MKSAFPAVLFLTAFLVLPGAVPAAVEAGWEKTMEQVAADHSAQEILARKTIDVATRQEAAVPIAQVIRLVEADDALELLQQAYAELLPEGEEPEFAIASCPGKSNHYTYVNRRGIRTDIVEIIREGGDDQVRLAYLVRSDRFFGPFTALICMQGRADGAGKAVCDVRVHAFPERMTSRFFIRHLRLVERFFDSKTDEMRKIFTNVVTHICREGGILDEHAPGQKPLPCDATCSDSRD